MHYHISSTHHVTPACYGRQADAALVASSLDAVQSGTAPLFVVPCDQVACELAQELDDAAADYDHDRWAGMPDEAVAAKLDERWRAAGGQ